MKPPILSGFCNPSWRLDTDHGRRSHDRCRKSDCPCACHTEERFRPMMTPEQVADTIDTLNGDEPAGALRDLLLECSPPEVQAAVARWRHRADGTMQTMVTCPWCEREVPFIGKTSGMCPRCERLAHDVPVHQLRTDHSHAPLEGAPQ